MTKVIPKNYVLVELSTLRHEKIATKSGSEIILDPTFHPEQHAQISGVVSVVPESLYFNEKDVMNSVDYVTDIDVKIGDKVFFHYLQINIAISNKRIIEEDGKLFVFVEHDSLFCGIRNDKVVMFNGWMLLKPMSKASDKEDKIIPGRPTDRQTYEPLMGEITHIGSPVIKYFYGKQETDSGINVNAGDAVIFLPNSDIPLEYGMHQSLDEKFYRVQRKELLAIIN
jgi:hypothetical protein